MSAFITFLVLMVAVPGMYCFLNVGYMKYGVVLNVFSGRDNPSWTVDRSYPGYRRLTHGLQTTPSSRLSGKLGYSGFRVEMKNMFGQRIVKTIGAGNNPRLEMTLLNSAPFPMEPAVRENVVSVLRRRPYFHPSIISSPVHPHPFPDNNNNRGRVPPRLICRLPRFDPQNWNFPPVQSRNNCYNYATQRRTNTFAQPGRATGMEHRRPITLQSVLSATIRDGFVPTLSIRPGTCYIALVIWPGVDFHFYRLDSDKLWSHKPGRTPAKNTDNSGNLITDPRRADRGSYVVFAGFLVNDPRAVVR